MNKLIFKKLEALADASPIAAYVEVYNDDSAAAEAVLYATTPYQGDAKELGREWVTSVAAMSALLVKWEAELKQRGVVS